MHLNYNHSPSYRNSLALVAWTRTQQCFVQSLIASSHIYSSKWDLLLASPYSIHVNRCTYMYMKVGRDKKNIYSGGKVYFQEIGTLTLLKPSQCYQAYLYSQLCRQGQTEGRHCCRGGIWSCWWPAQWTPPDARSEACWVLWWCEGSPGQHLWSGVSALSQALATHEALPLPHPKNGYCCIY